MKEYEILEENEEYDKLYGDYTIEIVKEDIEELIKGKKLYIPVNDEYALTIKVIDNCKNEIGVV